MDRPLRVYISYSRDDIAVADEIELGLQLLGFEPIVNRHGIAAAEDWRVVLNSLISSADTFVYLLSPSSCRSDAIGYELDHAFHLNKRLVPVLIKDLGGASPPSKLERLNYIRFSEGLIRGLGQLQRVLLQDAEWLKEETRLSELSARWEQKGRPNNLLLRGRHLEHARSWRETTPRSMPTILAATEEYIQVSADYFETSMQTARALPPVERARAIALLVRGSKIFISYRRSDARHISGRIYDHLERTFGGQEVFFDVDGIPIGENFRSHIERNIQQSIVLVAVISEDWHKKDWTRQSIWWKTSPNEDFVKIEIELAIEYGLAIIPVLVESARMPNKKDLPKSLAAFSDFQAVHVRAGTDFKSDMEKVISHVRTMRLSG